MGWREHLQLCPQRWNTDASIRRKITHKQNDSEFLLVEIAMHGLKNSHNISEFDSHFTYIGRYTMGIWKNSDVVPVVEIWEGL